MQALNLVRIISLYYLGKWNIPAFGQMSLFEFAHLYLWQALIMLDVLVVWLLWVRYLAARGFAGSTTCGLACWVISAARDRLAAGLRTPIWYAVSRFAAMPVTWLCMLASDYRRCPVGRAASNRKAPP